MRVLCCTPQLGHASGKDKPTSSTNVRARPTQVTFYFCASRGFLVDRRLVAGNCTYENQQPLLPTCQKHPLAALARTRLLRRLPVRLLESKNLKSRQSQQISTLACTKSFDASRKVVCVYSIRWCDPPRVSSSNSDLCSFDQVTSYGSIARQLGHPRHSRLVGQALKHLPARLSLPHLPQAPRPNAGSADGSSEDGGDGVDDEEDDVLPAPEPNPDWVPWHRVVASSGVISPRGNVAAVRTQAQWLEAEGVEVRDGPRAGVGAAGPRGRDGEPAGVDAFGLGGAGESGGRVSMSRYGWDGDE